MNTHHNSDTPAAPEPARAPAGAEGDRVPVWEPAGELGLIGVDDVALPYWVEVDQSVAESSTWMLVRSVPRVLAAVIAQAWRIAPGLTALAGLLQLASGVASAFGLLATAGVLTQLLEAGAPGAGGAGAARARLGGGLLRRAGVAGDRDRRGREPNSRRWSNKPPRTTCMPRWPRWS